MCWKNSCEKRSENFNSGGCIIILCHPLQFLFFILLNLHLPQKKHIDFFKDITNCDIYICDIHIWDIRIFTILLFVMVTIGSYVVDIICLGIPGIPKYRILMNKVKVELEGIQRLGSCEFHLQTCGLIPHLQTWYLYQHIFHNLEIYPKNRRKAWLFLVLFSIYILKIQMISRSWSSTLQPGEMKVVRFHNSKCISDSKDPSAVNVTFWKTGMYQTSIFDDFLKKHLVQILELLRVDLLLQSNCYQCWNDIPIFVFTLHTLSLVWKNWAVLTAHLQSEILPKLW